MRLSIPSVLAATLAAAALLAGTGAHATLGGDAASVDTDSVRMHVAKGVQVTPATSGSYTVHEATLPTGTVVRQYVSNAGVVFAVTWSGPFKPDLRQLMGTHFDTMAARQAGHVSAGHPFISQQNSDLVVESGGHQRAFFGRAYLPSAIPAGVTPQDIN
jgi:hypothetical protein